MALRLATVILTDPGARTLICKSGERTSGLAVAPAESWEYHQLSAGTGGTSLPDGGMMAKNVRPTISRPEYKSNTSTDVLSSVGSPRLNREHR